MAANTTTGQARRFVEIAEQDVKKALLGLRPASHQEALAERWGDRTGRYSVESGDMSDLRPVARVLEHAFMPVYGLPRDDGHDLALDQTGASGTPHGVNSVSLTFVGPSKQAIRRVFSVTSNDPAALYQPTVTKPLVQRRRAAIAALFREYSLSDRLPSRFGNAQHIAQTILLPGGLFHVESVWWPRGPLASGFEAAGDGVLLSGVLLGAGHGELIPLVSGLVPINDQWDLLGRYERDLQERRSVRAS